MITPSYRYQEANGGALGIFEFSLIQHEFSGRAEFGYRMSRRAALRVGTEVGAGTSIIDARAPSFPAGSGLGSTGVENVGRIEHPYANPAIYATASIGLGDRFVLYPGARLQYNAITINRAAFDPRLRFSWQVADRTQLKGGVGQFSQTPEITQFNDVWGNPNLGIERSLHTSFGVAQELDYGVDVEVTGFYKYVWDRVTSSDNLVVRDDRLWVENFANQGTGHIYGAELLVRKALTRRLFGWLSYTYIRSLVRQQPGRSLTPFDFDQPHILTLLAVYKLPRNWQIGGRFRLVSGNPNTPRTSGVFNAESGEYLPLDGERNSERLPAFHQLDVRVDKRWVLRRALITGYLDIQNLYNRQNIEAWNYSYNFRQRVGTAGLPIIPSL
ncbi:MAG: TonB-dependent receptor plug domain-containing protein, partial [Nannocystaceae bacterium]